MPTTIEVDRLVIYKELNPIFGIPYSKKQLDRMERKGLFPQRSYLGNGRTSRVVWRASELNHWIQTAPVTRQKSA